jgi:hypothetical protein
MARRVFDTEAKVLYKVEKREDHIYTVGSISNLQKETVVGASRSLGI